MPAGRLPGAWPSLRPWTRASRSRGRGASFWFQDMGAPRPERNRVHIGVWVPHDQAAARPAGRGRRPRGRTARARDGGRADRAAGGRAGGPGQQPARQSGRAAAAGRQPAPAQRHAPHARVVGRLGARHPAPDQVAKRPAAQNGHIRGRTLKSARRVPTSESHEQPDVGSGGPGPTCRCGPRGWSWWRSRCWRCCWPRWVRVALAQDRRAQGAVLHTVEVERQIAEVRILVQAGVTGYVLTGDRRYLTSYENARRELPEAVVELGGLVSDNPGQVDHVERVRTLVDQRAGILEALVANVRANRPAATRAELLDQNKTPATP